MVGIRCWRTKICKLLTTNLSLEMTCLRFIWRVSAQLSSQTWTIVLFIIIGIQIVWTDAGEVRLVRQIIWWGNTCLMTGASIILFISRKNPKYLWLWDITQRGIFLHSLCWKCRNWLLRYKIIFGTRGIWRGNRSPSRLHITQFVYWQYKNTYNCLLKEVWKINWLQRMPLST